MKKMMILLVAALGSLTMVAQPRQVKTNLPSDVPSVTVTIDGKTSDVKPTFVSVTEKDDSHITCVVKGTHNSKASVTLPISFDKVVDIAIRAAETAYSLGIITEEQYKYCADEYFRLTRQQSGN